MNYTPQIIKISVILAMLLFIVGPNLISDGPTEPLYPMRIVTSLLFSLPATGLLIFVTVRGGRSKRQTRDWRYIAWPDLITTFILAATSLGLGLFFRLEWPAARNYSFFESWHLIILSIPVAIVEELFFRSWFPMQLTEKGWSPLWAFMISILIFAFLHIWQGWSIALFAGIMATLYTGVLIKQHCLPTLILAHIIHNIVAILLS